MKFRAVLLAIGLAIATPAIAEPIAALSDPAVRVAADAARIRYYMAASVTHALTLLDEREQTVFVRALRGRDGADVDPLWARAIGPSIQMSRVSESSADVAWWNPALDAGLATRWRLRDGDWRLEAVAPFLGRQLRGERGDANAPDWMLVSEGSMAQALQSLAFETRAAVRDGALQRVFAAPASHSDVLTRALGAELTVHREARRPNTVQAMRFMRGLLVTSNRNEDSGFTDLNDALNTMPMEARLLLAPRVVGRRGALATYLWASPGAPDRVFLATFEDQTESQPALARMAAIDLSGAAATGATP